MSRLLLAAIVVLGAIVVARFTIWAPIDERAHYLYVESIADHGRLPRLTDLNTPAVQAISDRTFPQPSPTDPATLGLGGQSYEAFQPPLYYGLAAPVFAVGGNAKQKVYAVRVLDLLLYLGGVVVLWLLAGRRPEAFAAGLLVLLWPGLLVRGVTISNDTLGFLLAPAFMLAAWRASTERSDRWLAAAAMLLGACLLTKLTLAVLAPTLLIAAWACRRRWLVVLPALMLAPWLIDTHARFGSWTLNAAARAQQTPFLYPHGRPDWDLGDLPARFAILLKGAVPGEWEGQLGVWWVGIAARALVLALLLAVLLTVGDRRVRFFAVPVVAAAVLAVATLIAGHWDIFLLRYYAPVLAPLAVAVALARTPPRAVVMGAAVVTGLLWVDLLGAYLFTDVGGKLGI